MFLFVAITVLVLMYGFVGWRAIVPASPGTVWTILLVGLTTVLFLCLLLPLFLRFNGIETPATQAMSWIGYLGFGFISIVFVFFVLRDLGWVIWLGIDKIASSSDNLIDPGRRRLLINTTNIGLLGIGAALTGYGFYHARRTPQVREVSVPLRNLPEAFDGFRIIQITDIHAGPTIRGTFIRRVTDTVKELRADLIAHTGDLVDGTVARLQQEVASLAELSATYGKFFVTGNHEYYSGVTQWVDHLKTLGFDVLHNEHRMIEKDGQRICLAGITDHSGGQHSAEHRSDPDGAMRSAPPDCCKILLAHQPVSIHVAARAGYDLQISGHTHGGQYFPYHALVALFQPYVAGLHKHDRTWIYVSRGTGYWGPQIRVGSPSEITVITLKRGNQV